MAYLRTQTAAQAEELARLRAEAFAATDEVRTEHTATAAGMAATAKVILSLSRLDLSGLGDWDWEQQQTNQV